MARRLLLIALGIALCLVPNLARAQRASPEYRDANLQSLVERLEHTERILRQTQQEIESLRRDQQQRPSVAMTRLRATGVHHQTASYTGGESSN